MAVHRWGSGPHAAAARCQPGTAESKETEPGWFRNGAGRNADPGRFAGLRTPRWKRRLVQALDDVASRRADGRVALTFEVAYGHAWRAAERVRGASEVKVDLETLRATARSRPPRPPRPTGAG